MTDSLICGTYLRICGPHIMFAVADLFILYDVVIVARRLCVARETLFDFVSIQTGVRIILNNRS